ncbi:MAG TPA: hypothetical protein VD994_15705 [Prosthecobacter sp.]|nr:hypothetical protein [Prosthecobacter sp.]
MPDRDPPNITHADRFSLKTKAVLAGTTFLLVALISVLLWSKRTTTTKIEAAKGNPVFDHNAHREPVVPSLLHQATETTEVAAPDFGQVVKAREFGRQMLRKDNPATGDALSSPAIDLPKSEGGQVQSVAQRLGLQPLPETHGGKVPDLARLRRMDELRSQAAAEREPAARAKLLLILAAYHAGDEDWREVEELYAEIARAPIGQNAKAAMARNLPVVKKNLEIQAAADQATHERLQLQLSDLHQSLGHDKAARNILRELVQKAATPSVRQAAKLRYDQILRPGETPQAPDPSSLIR